MKKKVKKIPKYNSGGSVLGTLLKNNPVGQNNINIQSGATAGTIANGTTWGTANKIQRTNMVVDAAAGGLDLLNMATSGQKATVGTALSGIAKGASAGAMFGPVGAGVGAAVGAIAGTAGNKNRVNENSTSTSVADIAEEGSGWMKWFGMSEEEMMAKANRIANANISEQMTEQIRSKYAMNPNNPNGGTILAAEGGIIRTPVDALVSPGEIAIDPYTLEYKQFGSDNEEPNSKDNIKTVLKTGDIVKSHAKHMKMPNGKTPADNSKMVLDSNMPDEMKRKMIKKINNWESAHRTKPQEYAKFDNGGIAGINKYGYNKNMSDFAYWDKDKNEYKKEYLDWVNNLTEQDVRDIESGKYGDMSEYFSKNKGKKLDVATAQKLMTDKKYGNWHKIGQAVVDNKIKNTEPKLAEPWQAKMSINGVGPLWQDMYKSNYPIDYTVAPIDMKSKTLPNPSAADGSRAARKYLSKQNIPNWLDKMSNLLPVIGGLSDKYDWHTESSQITPPRFVPVNADPRPLLRAADESSSIGNYNLANMGVGTGAYMAHSAQLASDRAKRYADAHKWQQETNNKLIAQNAGIYNDWRKQRDAYATQAIADTRANEGAAQQMKDQARKDRLEFYYGKQNDDMLTAMLKPMFEYGTPDEAYRQIYKRRIV